MSWMQFTIAIEIVADATDAVTNEMYDKRKPYSMRQWNSNSRAFNIVRMFLYEIWWERELDYYLSTRNSTPGDNSRSEKFK